MTRITKKDKNYYYSTQYTPYENLYKDIIQKLGQLEDIEEELGIDLIILFKALKKGQSIFVKCVDGIVEYDEILISSRYIDNHHLVACDDISQMFLPFTDYGKGWALTRKELENDK